MKKLLILLVSTFLASSINAAQNEDGKKQRYAVANVVGNKISFKAPTEWNILSEKKRKDDAAYVVTLVPMGESEQKWSRLITIQGVLTSSPETSGDQVAILLKSSFKNDCVEGHVATERSLGVVNGLSATEVLMQCEKTKAGNNGGQGPRGVLANVMWDKRSAIVLLFASKGKTARDALSNAEHGYRDMDFNVGMLKSSPSTPQK